MSRPRDQERARQQALAVRLGREQTIWLATACADARPYLTPVWFVWHDEKIYICLGADSQEVINFQDNPRATLALPNTNDVLIIEGGVNFPQGAIIDALAEEFYHKYGWHFLDDQDGGWRLVKVSPSNVLEYNH